jgi:hypothetical protein
MQEPDRERTPPGALAARRHHTPAGEPGPVLARYLVDQATTIRVNTLTRRLPAIVKPHLLAGPDDPTGAPRSAGSCAGSVANAVPPSAARRGVALRCRTHPRRHARPSRTAPGDRVTGPRRFAIGRCCLPFTSARPPPDRRTPCDRHVPIGRSDHAERHRIGYGVQVTGAASSRVVQVRACVACIRRPSHANCSVTSSAGAASGSAAR